MVSERAGQPIRFEPDEPCSPPTALLVGLQGAALVLAPMVLIVTITLRAAGQDDRLAWGVFAALVINAAISALQASQVGRFGAGHLSVTGLTTVFIGVTVLAIDVAGPATLASLMVICSFVHMAMAWWLPSLRRIITPVVTGITLILVAVTILPIALDGVRTLGADTPSIAGPISFAVTLLLSVVFSLRDNGRWRIVTPLISILAGCLVGAAFGAVDTGLLREAAWFGVPEIPDLGLDLRPGGEFWALLPSFLILTFAVGIGAVGHGVATQQAAMRRPRAIDFRKVQGMVSANGVGMLLAGIAGTVPPMPVSSLSMTLISQTGVASRRVGIGMAVVFVAVAFFAKFTALLLTIPGPVLAAYLLLAMGLFIVGGIRAIVRNGLDAKQAMIVAISLGLGIALHGHPVMVDLLGDEIGPLFGSGLLIGTLVAIVMTIAVEALSGRSSRLEVDLEIESLPAIDEFLTDLAARMSWTEASRFRLRSTGEEALSCLLALEDDTGEPERPRLIIRGYPHDDLLELEFISTARRENIEDALAVMPEEASLPSADDLSLRLLRHHAAVVRHQKFHGLDVLTIWVEAGR